MLLKAILVVCLAKAIEGVYYNSYSGKIATEEDIKYYNDAGNLMNCTNDIALPCDPNERRRLDGSCNNLNDPTRGGYHTPLIRLLPADYSEGGEERLCKSGKKLPLAREVSTQLLLSGISYNPTITLLSIYILICIFIDIGTNHDSWNYINQTTYCCNEEGKSDYMCIPEKIPVDDPVHRFTGHRCMNLTRPMSFQTFKCIHDPSDTFSRMEFATSTMDLSFIYHPVEPREEIRTYSGGMLKVDIDDGTTWPPHEGPNSERCLLNQKSLGEWRCFGPSAASVLPANLVTVWMHREHNNLASNLALINPCWSDDLLFETAREINIAMYMKIITEELFMILFGKDFMSKSKLQLPEGELFRDFYNKESSPQITVEFQIMNRYMHALQSGDMNLYDENHYLVKKEDISNHTLRVGFLARENNLAKIARGSFIDPATGIDRVVHPSMVNSGLGDMQQTFDIMAADVSKNRAFGMSGFLKYVEYFTKQKTTAWDDMKRYMPEENIELLKNIYEDPSDVEALPGVWLSRSMDGGMFPEMFALIIEDQFIRIMEGDRFWYERRDRPHAFTENQLRAIKKSNMAAFMCDVADIKSISRQPFLRISPKNPIVSCDKIPRIDLSAWKDPSCQCSRE